MQITQNCQQCGATLRGHSVAWLCPRCLLGQAISPLPTGDDPASGNAAGTAPGRLHSFGDYDLLKEIARGGMGVVYKARHVSLNRIVAVKMLLFGRMAGDEFTKRFRTEAEAAASLQHPNIVAIHEVGEHEGQQYFSMDYVEGQDLAALVREKPLPARRAAVYLKAIAEAIHYAHQQGILHRDLKPSNVLIDPQDQPRITDFGLAKRIVVTGAAPGILASGGPAPEIPPDDARPAYADLTVTGQVLGTPHYMPPEQAGGKRHQITPASDVYSMGAILYHLLTGRPPFLSETLEAALAQLLHNDPVAPGQLNANVPRDLETICLKCLNKEPSRRYASAGELAAELGRWLRGVPIQARPVGRSERLWLWCRRRPVVAGLIVALLVVLGLGLGGILSQWRRAERNAQSAANQSKRAEQLAANETIQRLRAEEAVTVLELQRAEDLLEKDEIVMGVAYLARVVRQQPTHRIATRRLLSALIQRDFALPVGPPLQHAKKVTYAEFSPDGRRIATASIDTTARVWTSPTGEPLTPPLHHLNAVRFAHFSPNGQRLLTYGDDSSAHLWDAETGLALGQRMTHTKKIWTAKFSPDGRRILTASEDGTARLWDANSGKPVQEPIIHQGPVRSARFSPDGSRIVTASKDGTAQVWDAFTSRAVIPPLQHADRVDGAEFSPDGRWVVTVAGDLSTRVWDAASGRPLANPLIHPEMPFVVRFSPDGERIATAPYVGGMTRIWSAQEWVALARPMPHGGWATAAEFGPEAQRLLTASADNTARLWNAHTGEPLTPPMQHDGVVWSGRLSPDGLSAVTASSDKTARVWDVRLGGARSQSMSHHGPVEVAEFSPDGEWVVTGSDDGTARLWNSRLCQPRDPPLEHDGRIVAAQFSPDGERVATGSFDGTARIWDVRTGRPLTEPLRHDDTVDHLHFSPDGRWLATASHDWTVKVWNVATGKQNGEPIRYQSPVGFIRFSPDGERVLSGDVRSDLAQIREVATHRILAEMRGHEGWVMHAEFSPDGQRVATVSEDGTGRVWNVHTGQPLTAPLRHKGVIRWVGFSRDGRRLVTASQDTTAQVWDARNGQPLGQPLRHRGEVNMAEFSPDGELVVTASSDGTARIWDADTGTLVAEPFRHDGKLYSARFSPDGRRVLTAGHSGEARIWDVPSGISQSSGREAGRSSPDVGIEGTLLADIAEAVIGKRVNAQGGLESVSSARLVEIRQRVENLAREAELTHSLDWFFADRNTRTISPYSPVRVADYIRSRAGETNEASWREALMLCPTNGLAFASMAKHHLSLGGLPDSMDARRADWASRQAVKFAPFDVSAWQQRINGAEQSGAWSNLLVEAELAIQGAPHNLPAWNSKARALEGLGQFDGMLSACNRALEIWERDKPLETDPQLRRELLLRRRFALLQFGRVTEASADNAAGHGLAARDPRAGPQLIDLGARFNGGGAEGFPNGLQRLAGTDFDVRGWIHLDLRRVLPGVNHLPERVDGIRIERPCRRLHFLHTASFASHVPPSASGVRQEVFNVPLGTVVGHYRIHYADGQEVDIPILHGRDVRDYWKFPESTPDDPALVAAWTGSTSDSRRHGATTRLYKSTWENLRPDVPIRGLDFVHDGTHAVPILVAITADP